MMSSKKTSLNASVKYQTGPRVVNKKPPKVGKMLSSTVKTGHHLEAVQVNLIEDEVSEPRNEGSFVTHKHSLIQKLDVDEDLKPKNMTEEKSMPPHQPQNIII